MDLKYYSNSDLIAHTKNLTQRERQITIEILHHLREIESRKLYLERGYSSLLDFCVKVLHYSESASYRRISAMRILKAVPGAETKLKNGSLTLTNMAAAQSFFQKEAKRKHVYSPTNKKIVLNRMEGKSRKETDSLLAILAPEHTPIRDQERSLNCQEIRMSFTASKDLMNKLELIKKLLSHKHPNPSYAELINMMAEIVLKKKNPQRKATPLRINDASPGIKSKGNSYPLKTKIRVPIPVGIHRNIWKRDGGKCTYINIETGQLCNSQYRLQIDHVYPVALGGGNYPENLRLLCQPHNLFTAAKLNLNRPEFS